MSRLSRAEKLKIVEHFLLSTPPGEFEDVLQDVQILINDNDLINEQALVTFRKYNLEQLIPVEVSTPEPHKVILCTYGKVTEDQFFDPVGGNLIDVDHTLCTVTRVSPAPAESGDGRQKREMLQRAADQYVADRYVDGICTVFPNSSNPREFFVCISSSKFNEHSFWSGRWRSVYRVTFNSATSIKISGSMKLNVHYFENGNVQLNTSREYSQNVDAGSPGDVGTAVMQCLEKSEGQFQDQIDTTCHDLGRHFKTLRRALPITGTKFDFASLSHDLVRGMAGLRTRAGLTAGEVFCDSVRQTFPLFDVDELPILSKNLEAFVDAVLHLSWIQVAQPFMELVRITSCSVYSKYCDEDISRKTLYQEIQYYLDLRQHLTIAANGAIAGDYRMIGNAVSSFTAAGGSDLLPRSNSARRDDGDGPQYPPDPCSLPYWNLPGCTCGCPGLTIDPHCQDPTQATNCPCPTQMTCVADGKFCEGSCYDYVVKVTPAKTITPDPEHEDEMIFIAATCIGFASLSLILMLIVICVSGICCCIREGVQGTRKAKKAQVFLGKTEFGRRLVPDECKTRREIHDDMNPFTTIEPNVGVTRYRTPCLCSEDSSLICSPVYDRCESGIRFLPIKIIDVPGLIPGASEGLGLGNRFLDALRKADVLLHILDASGTLNERGDKVEQSGTYDVCQDVRWIEEEICQWIFGNLFRRWSRIVRLVEQGHRLPEEIFLKYLSGYGVSRKLLAGYLSVIKIESRDFFLRSLVRDEDEDESSFAQVFEGDYVPIVSWRRGHVEAFVRQFVKLRFPVVLVLNKIDLKGSTANIMRLYAEFPNAVVQPSSALCELFLKQLAENGHVEYIPGADSVEVLDAAPTPIRKKVRKIQRRVFEEYGTTGCFEAVRLAIDSMNPVLVRSVFAVDGKKELRDTFILKSGCSVDEAADIILREEDEVYTVEDLRGCRVGADDTVSKGHNDILVFRPSWQN